MANRIIKKFEIFFFKNKTERFRITRGERLKKLLKKNILKKRKKLLKERLIILFLEKLIIEITDKEKTSFKSFINLEEALIDV